MRRLLRLFLVAVLAAFCVSANVSAAGGIELVSLEPTFTSDAIEINETPSGYNFSITLLDSNLELNYDAVIKNNENSNITIESIDFTNSSYDFLEYSYEGISIGDTIGKEELRNIKLTIRTNAAEKQAVSEVFNLSFTYSYDDSGTNPSTGDVIVGAVSTTFVLGGLAFILIRKNSRRGRYFAILLALIPCAILTAFGARAATNTFTIKGQVNYSHIYSLTVDPNGGIYNGSEEPTVYQAAENQTVVLSNDISRDNFVFKGWEYEDGSKLNGNEVVVNRNITLKATWIPAVASINGTLYESIMAAEAAAAEGDTIVLLVDTEEEVTNSKKVTLDLNDHIVIGFIINTSAGDLTLINGTIENPDGAAVTNDGIFTMGIDDLRADGKSNIINDNVILIGTDVGLQQNNIFYFYDGYIEGDLALVGGYDGAPYYRNTFDETVVYYFPFVDHNYEKDCQRVQLESSDRAVTKTIVHGDIYYYNVQDNINTSSVTGYAMYAVRSFDASYPLKVEEGITIDFDIVGYNVHLGDTLVNNGTLNITDSRNNVGRLTTSKTITNNGAMDITDATLNEITASTLLVNNKNLKLTNSTLSSNNGYALRIPGDGTSVILDDDSYIKSTSSNYAAVYNNSTDFVFSSGNIEANYHGIEMPENKVTTISGGNIKLINTVSLSNNKYAAAIFSSYGILNITGGVITGTSTANQTVYGAYTDRGEVHMSGGKVYISDGNTGSRVGIRTYYGTHTFTGGEIYVHSDSTSRVAATGIDGSYGTQNISNLKIDAYSQNGDARGIYGYYVTRNISNIDIKAISNSDHTSWYGTGIYAGNNNITGGKIYGSQYGIRDGNNTLGANDGNISITSPEITGGLYGIYTGDTNFYDGVLKGGTRGFNDNSIASVATNSMIFDDTETIDEIEYVANYLVDAVEYIYNGDVGYKDLQVAINEAGDGDTLRVVLDGLNLNPITVAADRNVTIDLNNHRIQTYQPITNNGSVKLTDSSDEKGGLLLYTRSKNNTDYLITNNKTLEIENVKLQAPYVIRNMDNGVLNTSGATIYSTNTALNNTGEVNADSTTFNSSTYAIYATPKKPMTITNSNIICRATSMSSTGAIYVNSSQSDITISNSTINGYVYNNGNATLTISNSTIVKNSTKNSTEYAINNPGKIVLEDTSVSLYIKDTGTTYAYAINNNNSNSNLVIKGDSEVKLIDENDHRVSYGYGINNSGNVTIEKADIVVDNSHSTNNTYGLYNGGGMTVFKTGSIQAYGRTAYGIYINSGTVTLGIPEIVGSPTYGRDTADVSLTNPYIFAKGASIPNQTVSGVGVKNIGGSFNYYDGKIMGSTSAKPEIPTKIEYLYEAIDYTDDETGHPYCILEWMREQPEDPDTTDQPDEPSNPDQP